MKEAVLSFLFVMSLYAVGMDNVEDYKELSSAALAERLVAALYHKNQCLNALSVIQKGYSENIALLKTYSEERFPDEIARAQRLDSYYAQQIVELVDTMDECAEHEQVIRHIQRQRELNNQCGQ